MPPVIGVRNIAQRHHLEVCKMKVTARHYAALRAVLMVANGVAPKAVATEQGIDDFGAPRPPTLLERKRPGDLICGAGPDKWLFADLSVTLPMNGVLEERKPGSKHCLVSAGARRKVNFYSSDFAGKNSLFLPLVFSAYGGSSDVTNLSLKEFAKAVEAAAPVASPLGSTPLWTRFRDAITAQVLASPARWALELMLRHDRGPSIDCPPPPFEGDPQGSCRLAAALIQTPRLAPAFAGEGFAFEGAPADGHSDTQAGLEDVVSLGGAGDHDG